jgi:predicted transcriptional regulator
MARDLKRGDLSRNNNKLPSSILTGRIEYELELLHRHVEMLKIIMTNEPIGIIKLSNLSKIPQHKVRYSLRILEQESLIQPSPDGAITTKKCKEFMPKLKNILVGMEKTIKDLKSKVKDR